MAKQTITITFDIDQNGEERPSSTVRKSLIVSAAIKAASESAAIGGYKINNIVTTDKLKRYEE